MITTILFVLSILALAYFLANIFAATYIKYKNPNASVAIGAVVYMLPIVLLLATLVAHILKL